jgi:2-keto-4-pentenoate hydratase
MSRATRGQAERLLVALDTRVPIEPVRDAVHGLTLDDAYEIQRHLIDLRLAAGARRVGRKVGLTSKAMQEMLGVDQPDFGVLLDTMVVPAASGFEAASLIAPRAEPEIGFVLSAPLEGNAVDANDVLDATASVCAAIEIIDSRIAEWRIGIEDTVADNASSALVVLGEMHPLNGIDLAAERVTISVGATSERGDGAAVLGHPAEAVAWLARTLWHHGECLEAGDVVLPGAMTRALPFAAGDMIQASFTTLGELSVRAH